jgi:Protein of unknown function (DUF3604)
VLENRHGSVGRMKVGEPAPPAKGYSPYAGRKYPMQPLFGDTHLHRMNPGNAFTAGNPFTPEQTHRIVRSEEVTSTTGLRFRRTRPLDLVATLDHSEALDRLRPGAPRRQDDQGGADEAAGARVDVAHRVLARVTGEPYRTWPALRRHRGARHRCRQSAAHEATAGQFVAPGSPPPRADHAIQAPLRPFRRTISGGREST